MTPTKLDSIPESESPPAHPPLAATCLETPRLKLVLQTREEVHAQLEVMAPHERAEVSPAWLARLERSCAVDPWVHGFVLVDRVSGAVVGKCGFKGPPEADGVVEVAYGVVPEHQGKGYATEATKALVSYAFSSGEVRVVRAHTLPEANASGQVLGKCGFRRVGEVLDPDDGLVWRWERDRAIT
jgi:[ribosomal protein S5]-alanine N-acetyltransferase